MGRTLSQLTLAFLISTTSLGVARAAEPTAPPSPQKSTDAVADETIAALVRQLADPSTAKRDAAAKRLIQIGVPAKTQLEAASEGENLAISRRAKMLLLSISRRANYRRTQALANGEIDGSTLPGWKQFCEITGDTPEARQLFVKMHLAKPDLMRAYYSDIGHAQRLLYDYLSGEENSSFMADREEQSPSLVAPVVLVAGDNRVNLCTLDTAEFRKFKELLKVENSIYEAIFGFKPICHIDKSKDADGPKDENENENKKAANKSEVLQSCHPFRKLVARLLRHPHLMRDEDPTKKVGWKLSVAVDYDLDEGVSYATQLQLLAKENLGAVVASAEEEELVTFIQYITILCLAQLGDESDARAIESLLLARKEVVNVFAEERLAHHKKAILLCDIALATAIELRGQKFEDYNFRTTSDYNKNGHGLDRIRNVYFASEADRAAGIKKWSAWSKANPIKEKSEPAGENS